MLFLIQKIKFLKDVMKVVKNVMEPQQVHHIIVYPVLQISIITHLLKRLMTQEIQHIIVI